MIKRQKYIEIFNEFEDIRLWLDEKGCNTKNSRLSEYKATLEQLVIACENHDLAKFEKPENLPIIVDHIFEIFGLSIIYRGLKSIDDDFLNKRLQKIRLGPSRRGDERPGASAHSRNILFELIIASYLYLAGYSINFSLEPDVYAYTDDDLFLIECKRPYSESKVEKRLREACNQIKHRSARFGKSRKSTALVALSLDKIINPESKLAKGESVESIHELAEQSIQNFMNKHGGVWRKKKKHELGGLILFTQFTAIIENENILTNATYLDLVVTAPNGSNRFQQLERLSPKLKAVHNVLL